MTRLDASAAADQAVQSHAETREQSVAHQRTLLRKTRAEQLVGEFMQAATAQEKPLNTVTNSDADMVPAEVILIGMQTPLDDLTALSPHVQSGEHISDVEPGKHVYRFTFDWTNIFD